MADYIISSTQTHDLISNNQYPHEKGNFKSRCIDGRYQNDPDLPTLSLAGGDAGQLAILIAASNVYGFEIKLDKAVDVLAKLVGGFDHMGFHTDDHADPDLFCGGCGHMTQLRKDPEAYDLTAEQLEALNKELDRCRKNGAKQVRLQGNHYEGAVLIIDGPFGIYPRHTLRHDDGAHVVQVFIHHQSLVNERHKQLAEELIKAGAVSLAEDLDADYLYEVMSDICDNHLMETAKRLAPTLPIYGVKFDDTGDFKVTEMGTV